VAVAVLLACTDSVPTRPTAEAPASARKVRLARVESRKLARSLTVSGTLAADERVTVGVKVAGRLASIAVDLGSVVKQGEPIAQVEPTDYALRVEQAASAVAQARAQLGLAPDGTDVDVDVEQTSVVQEARATLEEVRASLERSRALRAEQLIAQAELDAAQATFLRAQSALAAAHDEIRNRQAALRQRTFELRSARQQLTDATVRTPLDGFVQERHAHPGQYLAAGASVATIVRVDPLRLRAEIPEREALLVRAGQVVRIAVEGDDTQHDGTVVRLAPALSEQTRSLIIEAEIKNPGNLRPGSFARAEIVLEEGDQVPVVPSNAIVTFAGIEKVITVEDGKAVEKEVKTGRRSEPWVEILSGVAVGDSVVVDPGNLQQEQPVLVTGAT
jgi:RND family efflux transporter MFP subunit